MNFSPLWNAWKDRARSVSIEHVARDRRLKLRRSGCELVGSCPNCGGEDRFAINTEKGIFNCRGCKAKGDVISLIQFLDDCSFLAACEKLTGEPPPPTSRKANGDAVKAKPVVVATYPYQDADGAVIYETQRIQFRTLDGSFVLTKNGKPKKKFWQRRPDPKRPGEFIYDLDGVELVPYRLPDLIRAVAAGERIYIVEGERIVDLLRNLGLAATCNPMGARKWPKNFGTYFVDADAVILPDNDKTGRDHASDIAARYRTHARSKSSPYPASPTRRTSRNGRRAAAPRRVSSPSPMRRRIGSRRPNRGRRRTAGNPVVTPTVLSDVPFFMIDAQVNLAPDADKLIADVKDGVGSTAPAVVVIDTLRRQREQGRGHGAVPQGGGYNSAGVQLRRHHRPPLWCRG